MPETAESWVGRGIGLVLFGLLLAVMDYSLGQEAGESHFLSYLGLAFGLAGMAVIFDVIRPRRS